MLIRSATHADIPLIQQLAHIIWEKTYRDILPALQIEFMLNDMYSNERLTRQFDDGIKFLMAENDKQPSAFASYSKTSHPPDAFKIHKLYILPEAQGSGLGKKLIRHIKNDAFAEGGKTLILNVNRNNPAAGFYQKCGFTIVEEVDIPYHDYILNDFVMQMNL